jgi:hypothetical protein
MFSFISPNVDAGTSTMLGGYCTSTTNTKPYPHVSLVMIVIRARTSNQGRKPSRIYIGVIRTMMIILIITTIIIIIIIMAMVVLLVLML